MVDVIVDTGICTSLHGYEYGNQVFHSTLMYDPSWIYNSEVKLYFHVKIRSVDRSFIQGFFSYLVDNRGIEWIRDKVHICPERLDRLIHSELLDTHLI